MARRRREMDWVLIATWGALVAIGLAAIYSATHTAASEFLLESVQRNFQRQLTWLIVCTVAGIVIMLLPVRLLRTMAFPVYSVSMALVLAALLFGREINGARSWVSIGPMSLQSSELAKVGTVLAVAQLIALRKKQSNPILKALGVSLLLAVPGVLIVLQNDTGTALVFFALIPVMLFWMGIPLEWILLLITPVVSGYLAIVYQPAAIAFAVIVTIAILVATRKSVLAGLSAVANGGVVAGVSIALAKVLQPYQLGRILSFVNPEDYRLTSGFHIIQARAAIGSGGLTGKGFLQGTQTQMAFVPEQSTDFVFAVVGEEFGFLGGALMLLIFGILLVRIVVIGTKIKHPFGPMLAAGVAGVFFVHILINIGMTVGLLPVIGIPLPFISYGGSALLANTCLLALVVNVYRKRDDLPKLPY